MKVLRRLQGTTRRRERRLGTLLVLTAALLAVGAVPAVADEPAPESVPSFNESPGCGALDGFRGPLASVSGLLSMDEPIYGPWADFYGRSVRSVWEQLVPVQLPGQSKTLYVHERVLPAFELVLENLAAEADDGRHYTITSNTWSWSRYTIPPTRRLSFHTVGAAIDVNSTTNPYRSDNVLITNMPKWFVRAWTDAGWCWGGDWQTIKDPMHFSWMGPIHTPGYEMPAPQAPLVGRSPFLAEVSLRVGLARMDAADHRDVVADVDRDGAVDVVRVEPFGADGTVGLRAAVARHRHETCTIAGVSAAAPTDPSAPLALTDLSGDGRADLAYVLESGATLELEVFENRQWGAWRVGARSTSIPSVPGSRYLFEDADADGATDLFVISPGDPARLTVWAGPGFDTTLVDVDTGVPATGSRFTVGDRDADGLPDLLALRDDGSMTIHRASAGWTAGTTIATRADDPAETPWAADLDGDGRTDLVMVRPNGQARLLRGGESNHDPGVWYVTREDDWVEREGCIDPAFDEVTVPLMPAASAGTIAVIATPRSPEHTTATILDTSETIATRTRRGTPVAATIVVHDGAAFGYVLLDRGDRARVAPLAIETRPTPGGFTVRRHEAIALQAWDGDGLAVLLDLEKPAKGRVLLRTSDGVKTKIRFGGMDPVAFVVDADRAAVLGMAEGGARVDIRTLDGDLVARHDFTAGPEPIDLHRYGSGYLVVLRSDDVTTVVFLDDALDAVGSADVTDAAQGAVIPGADGFLIARRTEDGRVVAEARSTDGSVEWRETLPSSHDPADIVFDGMIVVTSQRTADAEGLLVVLDPGTGATARTETVG